MLLCVVVEVEVLAEVFGALTLGNHLARIVGAAHSVIMVRGKRLVGLSQALLARMSEGERLGQFLEV